MAGSYPLAFGELVVGAILLSHGAKAISTGISGGGSDNASAAVSLTPNAHQALNKDQQTFASVLAADTGLDPAVVAAWIHAEEPASASHAPNGANNWLNIGAFDSGGWAGSTAAAWNDPTAAAHMTAHWLAGASIPGLGKASAGIRGILASVGKSATDQIRTIQHSGWASSGYPDLPTIYQSIA